MACPVQTDCYITGAKMRARWRLAGVSTNVSRAVAPWRPRMHAALVLFFKPVFLHFGGCVGARPFMLSWFEMFY